ncbi:MULTISPECIES: hypothetical protein [Pseudomonas]|uniref:hypothetical protein n=1 Tax=Pseudomonas sp. FW305-E2 TaxID=2075558 RepID=UPI00117A0DF9|nr:MULTISPECIES: hypothetical protein [Pseudomonas]
MSEPKPFYPSHQKRADSLHRVKKAIAGVSVGRAGAMPAPVLQRGPSNAEQLSHVVFSQKAHGLCDSFLHITISEVPAVMTVSASCFLSEPGVVPAACQYMRNYFPDSRQGAKPIYFKVCGQHTLNYEYA